MYIQEIQLIRDFCLQYGLEKAGIKGNTVGLLEAMLFRLYCDVYCKFEKRFFFIDTTAFYFILYFPMTMISNFQYWVFTQSHISGKTHLRGSEKVVFKSSCGSVCVCNQ